jgi:hypothetical protein
MFRLEDIPKQNGFYDADKHRIHEKPGRADDLYAPPQPIRPFPRRTACYEDPRIAFAFLTFA